MVRAIETDVGPERIARFFVEENGGFRVRKEVREMVVFAPDNLLSDPPFSRIDLIACRNLLIYLQRHVQQDVFELFHYALRPEGFLVLGNSESVTNSELFRVVSKSHCLFRKRNVPALELHLPVFPSSRRRTTGAGASGDYTTERARYAMLHQRMVEQYGPPSMLVSPANQVVHLSEHVGRYLTFPGGELTANAFQLLRPELRIELRAALHTARSEATPVRTRPIDVALESGDRQVVLHVRPALDPDDEGFALVFFEEGEAVDAAEAQQPGDETGGARVARLEAELDRTKRRLQTIIDEYEAGQEEMKASQEEMQSSNEELRSTMEELETSKEELQSMNEELQTVNEEHRHKVEQLALISSDLQNLLASTDIATLFLDRELCIMRFTPQVAQLFNVRQTDRGRPLLDLTHRLRYDDLEADARQVLENLDPVEREVQDDGRWYLMRVLPYRSAADRVEGVVITLVEISRLKRAEQALRDSEERFRALVDASATSTSTRRRSPRRPCARSTSHSRSASPSGPARSARRRSGPGYSPAG